MNIVPLLVLCSLALAGSAVVLFLYSICQGDHDHADRLSLLPLESEPEPSQQPQKNEIKLSRLPHETETEPTTPQAPIHQP